MLACFVSLPLSSTRLLIKSAILMPGAKEGEVTVVQIESQGYNKQKVGDSSRWCGVKVKRRSWNLYLNRVNACTLEIG